MAGSGEIRAGKAYVELGVRDRLDKGLKAAQRRLKAFAGTVASIGGKLLAGGSFVQGLASAATAAFTSVGSELIHMSEKTGIGVEALSELKFAAEQSGLSLEDLDTGLKGMAKFLLAVSQGGGKSQKTLKDLHLTAGQLKKLSPEQQFELLADRISKVADPTKRAGLAIQVFGKQGRQLIPLLEGGAAGIEALRQEARDLGVVMTAEDAEAALHLSKSLAAIWSMVKAGVVVIGAQLAPAMQMFADKVRGVVAMTLVWIKANPEVFTTIKKIGLIVLAAGAALLALSGIIAGLGIVFGGLATVLSVFAGGIGVVASVVGFLLTPIGAVVGALAALAAYFLYTTDAGGQTASFLTGVFGDLKTEALTVFDGIAAALATGDISQAATILWLELKKVWKQGAAWLTDIWEGLKDAVIIVGSSAFSTVEIGWLDMTNTLGRAWQNFIDIFKQTWWTVSGWFQKRWAQIKSVFDDTIDAAAEYERIDAETKGKTDANNAEFAKYLAAQKAGREKKAKEEMALNKQVAEDRAQHHADAMKDADEELAAATKARDQAIQFAKQLAETQAFLDRTGVRRGGKFLGPEDDKPKIPGFEGVDGAIKQATSFGSFSASAIAAQFAGQGGDRGDGAKLDKIHGELHTMRRLLEKVRQNLGLPTLA